jgi:hypothetical protein
MSRPIPELGREPTVSVDPRADVESSGDRVLAEPGGGRRRRTGMPRSLARTAAILTILVAVLAGCGSEDQTSTASTEPPLADPSTTTTTTPDEAAIELSRSGGCADAFFWAASADGELAVTAYVDVRDRQDAVHLEIDLPDPPVEVTLQRGTDLTQPFCNDVLDQDYELEEEVPVTEGHLELTVDAARGDGHGFRMGTLVLTDLVAEDGTRLPDLEITTEMIGMYAG